MLAPPCMAMVASGAGSTHARMRNQDGIQRRKAVRLMAEAPRMGSYCGATITAGQAPRRQLMGYVCTNRAPDKNTLLPAMTPSQHTTSPCRSKILHTCACTWLLRLPRGATSLTADWAC